MEFFYYKVYQISGPRPVPTPMPILFRLNSNDCLGVVNLYWKFEGNRLKNDEVMNGERGEKKEDEK